ncbi:hypothetical protein QYM36_015505 [Artemia franciscana]|uniref:Uncharacterized protein n=1 Tax=Artemia franciscana TaxID=6661 RepID=A0AA88L4Q1_ARTSF|nr:hypothetical protein QYM36_015505 [Artemia franciscana]
MEQNFANMQQNFQKEICVLKDIITEKDSQISKLEETLEAQRTTQEKANERLLQLEVRDRRHNLILHGLPKEKRGDSLRDESSICSKRQSWPQGGNKDFQVF